MNHISFLQLGDVHYPDLLASPQLVDHKDKGISLAMVGTIGASRIGEISREINRVRQNESELVAIVLNGDLTTKGDPDGYESCLSFLHKALNVSDLKYWGDKRILAVPGNHDINRRAISIGQDLNVKFVPLQEGWAKIFGTPDCLAIETPRATDLPLVSSSSSGGSIRFLPINTCYLCGEYRAFPSKIREKMLKLLDELKSTTPPDEFELLVSEQIDCPAVHRDHVVELGQLIRENVAESISVVIGHHPLFAQPMPRIDGYNELLNAGYIRESVLQTMRDVIYLHGHIHQDPLLIVNSPVRGGHRIIHVSAPALEDGFNLVRVYFSETTNQPVSLEVIPHRFGDHFGLVRNSPIRVRLIDQEALWNEIDQPMIKHILEKLEHPATVLRFNDLVKTTPKTVSHGIPLADVEKMVSNSLKELELLELVSITNREKTSQYWQCRRKSI